MKSIVDIIKEEIEQFDWGKEKVADEPIKPNRIVYHVSDPNNRVGISQKGIEARVGDSYSSWSGGKKAIPAVFATNSNLKDVTGGANNFGADVWAIDTTKTNNQWYEDKHFAMFKDWGMSNPHIVTFENIPKESVFLAHKVAGNMNEDYNHANYLKWKRQNVTLRGIRDNNNSTENGGMAKYGQGLYTAFLGNKDLAKQYGKVYFVVNAIPKHPKIVYSTNDAEMFEQQMVTNFCKMHGVPRSNEFFSSKTTIADEMQRLGYDGLVIKGREMVNYTPPSNVLYFNTEQALQNYYDVVIEKNEQNS